ncbi:MAG: hypothetical protein QW785_01890 [Candidatus Anstonellales archaeon]
MTQFSISNSLNPQNIDLKEELGKLGFNDKEIDILLSRKTMKYKFLSDSEFLDVVKSTLDYVDPKNNLSGFLKVLDVNANKLLRTKFSTMNQQSEIYIVNSMLEFGIEYSDAKRILKLYKSQVRLATPYDFVDVARKIYRPNMDIDIFINKLFRALGEIRFVKDEFTRKGIVFKYQIPPYVIDQEDFDIGVDIAVGKIIIDNKELYREIREMVSDRARDVDLKDLYAVMIDDRFVESYSKVKEVLDYGVEVVDLIASILYVAAGGRFRSVKNIS